ncbi:methyltransferase domain-containing protein [Pseudonocardia kujensis]|uniref:methyltransferase domain-containing protein n=1 Tax=Pseudonocardia kujensis TaxID=1128675 RepID=UPI001E60491E|nr:methyltransferase domain-containing protein [Pseudonocardia kujensis]MCE0768234.1 methyltransferase domain-containing protein [Pseudonocardia kujensis]
MTHIPGLAAWVGAAVPTTEHTVSITPCTPATVTVTGARASPEALPLEDDVADCVVLDRVLPALERPDALLAEVRRVLRPAGSMVAVVPAPGRSLGALRRGVRRGLLGKGWACPAAVDHPGWLLAAADFAVLGDVRATFEAPAEVESLVSCGAWPEPDASRREAVERRVARLAAAGRTVPVGFRRLVGRR